MRLDITSTTLSDIMKRKVVTVKDDALVAEAVRKMAIENIGAVVVIGNDNNIVGIFSERDLLRRVASQEKVLSATIISEVMTRDPVVLKSDTLVTRAFHLLHSKNFRHAPIVDDGVLVGMISIRDINGALIDVLGEIILGEE